MDQKSNSDLINVAGRGGHRCSDGGSGRGVEVEPLRTPVFTRRPPLWMGGRKVGVRVSGGVSQKMGDGTDFGHSGLTRYL